MATQKFDIKMSRSTGERSSEDIIVGRFPPGSLANLSGRALNMGYLDEDIKEDADLASIEKGTSEYYARRRKRRYKNQTTLCIDERARGGGSIKMHGSLMDMKAEGGSTAKYALFETVSRGGRMEVNMIPVEQWYNFKKPSRAAAITLDDLEIAFAQQKDQKAAANKKFSKIMQAMELKSREFDGKVGSVGKDEWGADGGSDIAFGAPLFGPLAMKALSRSGARSMENKKFKGYMDDAGGIVAKGENIDMEKDGDEVEIEDTFRDRSEEVDFDNNFSDDDNDADALQKADEDREDTLGHDIDVAGAEESDEEGYEDSGADSDSGGKDDVGGSGLYESDNLVRSAREYNFLLKQQQQKKKAENEAFEGESFDQPAAKKLKLSPEASKGKSEMKESAISKSVIAVNTSSASSSGAQNFEFSETGIRQFITVSGGGRTTVKKILEQYKKQMKSIGPNAAARLKEMLLKVTTTVEDPVLGKILILK